MPEPILTKCMTCNNFLGIAEIDDGEDFTVDCLAYPEGIPDEVLTWNEPHLTVRSDQQGTFIFDESLEAVAANPGIPDVIPLGDSIDAV